MLLVKNILPSAFLLFISITCMSQFNDDFADGNFSNAPAWNGDTTNFEVNPSFQLHLNAPSEADTSYLSTPSIAIYKGIWEFYIELDFNPSSNNYSKVYLVSDQPNLKGALNGYFVKVGNTQDEISLYRQDGWNETKIIDGVDDKVDVSHVKSRIKVTRDSLGNWQLFSDTTGGINYSLEGSVLDQSHTSSSFFGVFAKYTSSRSDKFFFDDFNVTGSSIMDTDPPLLDSVIIVNNLSLDIYFNEPIDISTAENNLNYSLDKGIGNVSKALRDTNNTSLVHLTFTSSLINGTAYNLTITSLKDTAGNTILPIVENFSYLTVLIPTREDVIINEIFADPTPQLDLPPVEYVELYNASDKLFVLENWKWINTTTSKSIPHFLFYPGSYVILCDINDTSLLQSYGDVIGISAFPILVNGGDSLTLLDHNDSVVDIVHYTTTWYKDDEKANGGWSLERIRPIHACSNGNNWKASNASIGGTPGSKNSVYDGLPDLHAPEIDKITILSLSELELTFTETMEKMSLLQGNYSLSGEITIGNIMVNPNLQQITLELNDPIDSLKLYTLKINNVMDCSGNVLNSDSILFSKGVADTIAPIVDSIQVQNENTLTVFYSESMEPISVQDLSNYIVDGSIGNPVSVIQSSTNSSVVDLIFPIPFTSEKKYHLTITKVRDILANTITPSKKAFTYLFISTPEKEDVVINEIFADPTPSIDLPPAEYVELFNTSNKLFHLENWQWINSSTSKSIPSFLLYPKSYAILCDVKDTALFRSYGNVVGIPSFTALSNYEDSLTLSDADGNIIDIISYNNSWYQDKEKAEGGWSLERIHPIYPCEGSINWTASIHPEGGTPGRKNAVFETTFDNESPEIMQVTIFNDSSIIAAFSETMDTQSFQNASFDINDGISVVTISKVDDKSVQLHLDNKIQRRTLYELSAYELYDCEGNVVKNETVEFAKPEQANVGDLIINEVLFNPRTGGSDFIEIYNLSEKYVDLNDWGLANFQGDSISNRKPLTKEPYLLFPQEFLVLTKDIENIQHEYFTKSTSQFIEIEALPSYPDDRGTIILLNSSDEVMDRFDYTEEMHFELIDDPEGISLERIAYNRPTNDRSNWHSAADPAGFATPGYANSQHGVSIHDGLFTVSPEQFSPNNDGFDDVVTISYNFETPGYAASVTIYDAEGRLIKKIVNNELLGTKGSFNWNGITENRERAPLGIYVVHMEAFNLQGKVLNFKRTVVLASRLN